MLTDGFVGRGQGCAERTAYGTGGGGGAYQGMKVCGPKMGLSFLVLYSQFHFPQRTIFSVLCGSPSGAGQP